MVYGNVYLTLIKLYDIFMVMESESLFIEKRTSINLLKVVCNMPIVLLLPMFKPQVNNSRCHHIAIYFFS